VRKVLFIFGKLSDADVEWLAANGERKTFRKGSVLVQQGKEIEDVFILLEGQLSVLAGSAQKDLVINTLQQGEIIGELNGGAGCRRPAKGDPKARTT
jgi:CRP/FNR family transcriptional regulator, cyclic AMP receptor protein